MPSVKIKNSQTGEEKIADLNEEQIEGFSTINEQSIDSSILKSFIDNLTTSAQTKVILDSIYNFTIQAGEVIIYVGRKIIELLTYFANKYPSVTIGGLIGFIIGTLISTIPFIGWILGPVIIPLTTALGLVAGLATDLSDSVINTAVTEGLNHVFGSYKGAKV